MTEEAVTPIKRPMMKCGHAANAVTKGDIPACAICIGIHEGATIIDDSPASLEGRIAECMDCHGRRPSDLSLPFFEHKSDSPFDKFYCGCRGWD